MPPPPEITNPSRDLSKARLAVSGTSLYLVERAPMASNMALNCQLSASPAPANTMSALPSWICSIPVPMQCAPVEHADEIEYDMPCSLNAVVSTADTVLPMVLVTRYGPTPFILLLPFESNSPPLEGIPASHASIASVTSSIEVPPCPRMAEDRGPWYCSFVNPLSSMALCMAMYAYCALTPMKRSVFRSMAALMAASSRSGLPHTRLLSPTSVYFSEALMPETQSWSDVLTSSRVLPRQDVMPIPVTTTRFSPVTAIIFTSPRWQTTGLLPTDDDATTRPEKRGPLFGTNAAPFPKSSAITKSADDVSFCSLDRAIATC
mmetsp:Transcript_58622/g.117744  ORF Transcript_58622/g.117744 Transcript_58622/m.117744 type:complete len:320 (-) Transcript_58622:15-974(-)